MLSDFIRIVTTQVKLPHRNKESQVETANVDDVFNNFDDQKKGEWIPGESRVSQGSFFWCWNFFGWKNNERAGNHRTGETKDFRRARRKSMGQDLKADRKELFEGRKQKRLVKRTL